MQRSIIWFKTDLRLHDNEVLIRAIEQSTEVVPVYCFDERDFKTTEFGFLKTGNFRAQFLLESLTDLDASLRALGSGLIILFGKPEIELYEFAKKNKVQKVYAKKEVTYEEKLTEEAVEKELWKAHCSLEKFSTSTLYHAQDLPFTIKDIPDIFTTFRKKIEKDATIRKSFDAPIKINSPVIPLMELPSLEKLGLSEIEADCRKCFDFKGGETEGVKRINYYFHETKFVSSYKETRNGMVGENYSTKFSPWLALGCLSPREIYAELKKYEVVNGANDSTYWLEFELLWRDYFRFMMKKYRHKFFLQTGIKEDERVLQQNNQELLNKWINGATGVDFIDANMIELKCTGFMSNRGRQNVASYLCNDLKLDWRYGAAYFEQQLIDYDASSNWGNWAYLAGVGNDPRANRYFDIEKQAMEYDANKSFRNLWLNKI